MPSHPRTRVSSFAYATTMTLHGAEICWKYLATIQVIFRRLVSDTTRWKDVEAPFVVLTLTLATGNAPAHFPYSPANWPSFFIGSTFRPRRTRVQWLGNSFHAGTICLTRIAMDGMEHKILWRKLNTTPRITIIKSRRKTKDNSEEYIEMLFIFQLRREILTFSAIHCQNKSKAVDIITYSIFSYLPEKFAPRPNL